MIIEAILKINPNAQVTVSTTSPDPGAGFPFTDGKTDANGNFIFSQGATSICGTSGVSVGDTFTLTITVSGGKGGPDNDGVYVFNMRINAVP